MLGKIQDQVSAAIVIGAANSSGAASSEGASSGVSAEGMKQAQGVSLADTASQTVGLNAAEAQNSEDDKDKKMDEDSVSLMTDELNELMNKINCDLEFHYNKEVNLMSVKMIDKQTQDVIKEFPPEEMIENMMKARDWLGAFLDKNA